jgi:hypothetical protein
LTTYTYDPVQISKEKTISRARFELGDTMVDGGAESCMLSDEEIKAIIESTESWKMTLFKLADAVCLRLSYETDWKDDGTSFSLNQRAERWMKLRDRLKADADAEVTIPVSGAVSDSINNPRDGGHYFYAGMMENHRVQPPMPFRGGRR